MGVDTRLSDIALELKSGREIAPITVREFLSWYGALRRGSWIVGVIRDDLRMTGLVTDPDFESVYIDGTFSFKLNFIEKLSIFVSDLSAQITGSAEIGSVKVQDSSGFADPTYRLSKLASANNVPICVSPFSSIQEAVTLMLANDFSQLPVMNGREVKGIVSWSSIASRLGLGIAAVQAKDVMDIHQEISADASLFEAIPIIVQHQYVLVRGKDKSIVGIVTASDLSLQFQQLTEPFLLIGEIENHIRKIMDQKYTNEELVSAIDRGDRTDKSIEMISDLTFGEYLRIIENPDRWEKLNLSIDRTIFCKKLEKVRTVRNDVMHFDPDGIPTEDLDHLRNVVRLLQKLHNIGATKYLVPTN